MFVFEMLEKHSMINYNDSVKFQLYLVDFLLGQQYVITLEWFSSKPVKFKKLP